MKATHRHVERTIINTTKKSMRVNHEMHFGEQTVPTITALMPGETFRQFSDGTVLIIPTTPHK